MNSLLPFDLNVINFYIIFGIIILIPSLGFAFLKLNLKYFVIPLCGFVISIVIKYLYFNEPYTNNPTYSLFYSNIELIIFIAYSLVSFLYTELFRRSHKYVIANNYIKTSAGILNHRERILSVNKINDIAVSQSAFGKIFNYGTIIPITASGLGMGFNFASITGAGSMRFFRLPYLTMALTGGHAIQIPKSRTYEALVGISSFKKALKIITDSIEGEEKQSDHNI